MKEIITLISASAAFITASAAFITAMLTLFVIREMKRQRKSTYLPEFALLQTKLNAFIDINSRIKITNIESPPHGLVLFYPRVYMNVANVGVGSAKNIQLEWSFDIQRFIKLIKNLDTDNDFNITCDEDFLSIEGTEKSLLSSMSSMQIPEKQIIDYVLPAHIQSDPSHFELPYSYISLCELLLFLVMKKSENNSTITKMIEPINIELNMTYSDIGNSKCKCKYKINFHVGLFSLGRPEKDDHSVPCMQGMLIPKRIR